MVDQLNARGVTRIYLQVEQSNSKAIALYQRNGFRSIGKLPNYYGPGCDGVHMMLDLTASPTLFDGITPPPEIKKGSGTVLISPNR
jgi:ribosomal protein S18 acetylase RimI-like enzyme